MNRANSSLQTSTFFCDIAYAVSVDQAVGGNPRGHIQDRRGGRPREKLLGLLIDAREETSSGRLQHFCFHAKAEVMESAVKSSTVLMLQLARTDTRGVLAVTGTGIVPLANCYAASHSLWPVILVAALIVAVSLGALARSRSVARAIVENLLGPWHTDRFDAETKTEWRDSIGAWISIVRVLIAVFAVAAILIAIGALGGQISCT